MPTLIENILSLEARASETVASARVEADAVARRADEQIAAARAKLAAETNAKLAALEEETTARCGRDVSDVETEFQAAYASIDGISSAAIQEHAAKIAAAFAQG